LEFKRVKIEILAWQQLGKNRKMAYHGKYVKKYWTDLHQISRVGRHMDDDDDDDERLTCPEMTESTSQARQETVKESSAERDESSDDCRT